MQEPTRRNRRWRDYRTAAGRRPVKQFLDSLGDRDAAEIVAAMKDVQRHGLPAARHLRGDIYEIRADGDRQTFRILFALEGRRRSKADARLSTIERFAAAVGHTVEWRLGRPAKRAS